MEIPVGIALIVGSIILLVGLLILVVQAFKQSTLWGLAVLLIPFAGFVFAFRFWEQARNGFLISVVGLLITAVSVYGGGEKEIQAEKHLQKVDEALDKAGVEVPVIPVPEAATEKVAEILDKRPGNVDVPNQAAAEAAGIDTEKDIYTQEAEEEEEGIQIQPLSPYEQVPSPEAQIKTVKMSLQPVSRKRLPDYLGYDLRVHLAGGEFEEGVLESVNETGDSLSLKQRVSAGEITYEYPFSKIEWLEVFAEAGTVPAPEEEVPAPTEVTPRFLPKDQLPPKDEPVAPDAEPQAVEVPVTDAPAEADKE